MTQNLASTDILAAALAWHDAGCSVIPIRADGTKKPRIEWNSYIQVGARREEVFNWFRTPAGIGVICGKVSGNLEMLELEGRACNGNVLDQIIEACGEDPTFLRLLQQGYCEWTPSGGLHFLYRVSDHEVPGNTKVARRPASEEELAEKPTDKIKVLAETRGEGGYVVVAPSGGTVHATGDSWSVAAGAIGAIPTITWAQRQTMTQAMFDVLDEMPTEPQLFSRPSPASLLSSGGDRPGDDFNARASWQLVLQPYGWTVSHQIGGTTYWVRPGKTKRDGHSATTGHSPSGDRLYVFSSSTEFTPETPYDKFSAWTLLEHGGDFSAAARALRALGYGGSSAAPVVAQPAPMVAAATDSSTALEQPAALPHTAAVALRGQWTRDWVKPLVPADAFIYIEHSYNAAGRVYAGIFEDTFKFSAELKKWYFWNGRIWGEDKKERHQDAVGLLLDEARKQAKQKDDAELTKWARTMGRSASPNLARWARHDPRIAVAREEFDSNRHMITVNNGVIDLDGLHFQPGHDPRMMLTKSLPVTFDKDALSPRWDLFLAQVLPDANIRDYVQRAAGLTLLGDAEQRALFLCQGETGSGKSQFVRVLELLFGDFAETAASTTFNGASKNATITNDLNDLRGKRFVSLSELDEDERLNESLVKRLTGGDTAKSRGLYQENAKWRVEFMLWMVTNHLPRLSSDDNAIWRRVKLIKFPTTAKDDHGGEIVSLGEKLFAAEASGILNWLLEGVRKYQDHGLDDLDIITEAVATYRHDVDTVAQFVEAACENGQVLKAPEQRMPSRNLHVMYQDWCKGNGIRWLGERRFAQRMESLGFERIRISTGVMWVGIGVGSHGMLGTMR